MEPLTETIVSKLNRPLSSQLHEIFDFVESLLIFWFGKKLIDQWNQDEDFEILIPLICR